jgi:hypothetical protein
MTQTQPLSLETRTERFEAARKTPAQRRRLKKAVGRAIGRAQDLRGAARKSAMRKLAGLPLDNIIVDEDTLLVLRDPKWDAKPIGTPKIFVKEGNTTA